jgi:hypothetical protein
MPLDNKQIPSDAMTKAASNAVSGVLDVLIDRGLIEPSPPHANTLLGEQIFEVIITTASLIALSRPSPTEQQDSDGLVCEMCDEPSSCPAENCAFRVNAAGRIEAMKRQLTEVTQSLAELLVMVKALGHGDSAGARHADKLLEPFRKALGKA